jgi:hypothetical protein
MKQIEKGVILVMVVVGLIMEKVSNKSKNKVSQGMENSDGSIQNSMSVANVSNVKGDVIQNINIVNENQTNKK